MKTKTEISRQTAAFTLQTNLESLVNYILILQKEAYLEGQQDEFEDCVKRTNKLLTKFGI